LPHHHDPVDGFAAGQELRLGEDRRATPSGLAAVAATLALGLEPGGPGDALHLVDGAGAALVARFALVHDRVRRIVVGRFVLAALAGDLAPPAPAPSAGGPLGRAVLALVGGFSVGLLGVLGFGLGGLLGGGVLVAGLVLVAGAAFVGVVLVVGVGVLFTATPAPAATTTTTATRLIIGLGLLAGVLLVGGFVLDVLGLGGGLVGARGLG